MMGESVLRVGQGKKVDVRGIGGDQEGVIGLGRNSCSRPIGGGGSTKEVGERGNAKTRSLLKGQTRVDKRHPERGGQRKRDFIKE